MGDKSESDWTEEDTNRYNLSLLNEPKRDKLRVGVNSESLRNRVLAEEAKSNGHGTAR
jgi:hypothetical protein